MSTVQVNEWKPSQSDLTAHEIVKRQFGMCCTQQDFFDDFYRDFTRQSPEILAAFAHTDMQQQKGVLQSGLTFLIMFASGSTYAGNKLDRLGQTHSRTGYNIRPQLYPLWVNSLVRTVQKHVVGFDRDAEQAWRRVLELGVNRIRSAY